MGGLFAGGKQFVLLRIAVIREKVVCYTNTLLGGRKIMEIPIECTQMGRR